MTHDSTRPGGKPSPRSTQNDPTQFHRRWRWLLFALLFHSSPQPGIAATGLVRYDAEQRIIDQALEDAPDGSPRRLEFLYDADGLRVGWVRVSVDLVNGGELRETNRFLFDPLSPAGVAQVLARMTDGRRTRMYLNGAQPAAEIEPGSAPETPTRHSYLVSDGHLSVRATADDGETAESVFDYDAFGMTLARSGPPDAAPDHRYAGAWFESDLGTCYLGSRRYDPSLGRLLTADTAEGSRRDPASLHRYLYTRGDPVNRVDPDGHSDYTLKSFAIATSISATLATLDTYVATRGRATPRQLAGSFGKGALMGAGGYLVAPLFYAAGAGGRMAFNSMSLATGFWGLGTALEARDAPLFAYRALMLSLFSGAAENDPSVRVYRVEGEPNTRVLISDEGEIALQGGKVLYLNFGQRARAEEFLAQRRAGGMPGAAIKSFEVRADYLRELQESAIPEHLSGEFPDRPIQVEMNLAPDQFGIRAEDFGRLLEAILQGSGRVE